MPLVRSLPAALLWLLQCIFACNHWRTPVNEGKCFCPDCGAGVIYCWMVLRCAECRVRRESRYLLRQVMPSDRCCACCGAQEVIAETLESPAYYQLGKARLIAQTEADFERDLPALWTVCRMAQAANDGVNRAVENTINHTMRQTQRLLTSGLPAKNQCLPALATVRR